MLPYINVSTLPEDSTESMLFQAWSDLGLCQGHEAYTQSVDHIAAHTSPAVQEHVERPAFDTISFSDLRDCNSTSGITLSDIEVIQTFESSDSHKFGPLMQGEKPVERSGLSHLSDASPTTLSGIEGRPQTAENLSTSLTQRTVNDTRILSNFRSHSIQSEGYLLHSPALPMDFTPITPRLEGPKVLVEDYDCNQNYLGSHSRATESTIPAGIYSMAKNRFTEERTDIEIRISIGTRSSQASALSITSLNRRLSSKYSKSDLEDILTVMNRLTITRSSASFSSSTRTSTISSKKSSRSFQRQSEISNMLSVRAEEPILPNNINPPIILPGIFHRFCMAQMNQGLLQPCCPDGLCEHACPNARRFFVSQPGPGKVLYRRIISRGINDTDQFGNTILHVAASLRLRVPYILKLIDQKASINATNVAGQTFLHLLYVPNEAEDLCTLLEILSISGFNFYQQDQHGQTSLHCLTRAWLPFQYLTKVIRKAYSLGIVTKNSRDNRGFTLMEQMNLLKLGFKGVANMSFNLPRSSVSTLTASLDVHPNSRDFWAYTTFDFNQGHMSHEKLKIIETVDDRQRYYHADLLRTIVKAGNMSQFEDDRGRNGLHCLAEVMIDMPQANSPTSATQTSKEEVSGIRTKREEYLEGLLAAGVNPNNYDEEGNTPLMAFITHVRAGEGDAVTTRILNKLFTAKADIHRRNRNGETALHLAVKLGRRAATKFLLAKGANVHARNMKGQGIIEVGTQACEKCRHNDMLYGQIMLCMCLATSLGAVSSPTILQEWASWPGRS
jgi:ankyrin repeat protein